MKKYIEKRGRRIIDLVEVLYLALAYLGLLAPKSVRPASLSVGPVAALKNPGVRSGKDIHVEARPVRCVFDVGSCTVPRRAMGDRKSVV